MKLTVEVSITRTFVCAHSLPGLGVAERHEHSYVLECGFSADVDPHAGCVEPLQELARDVDAIVGRLGGAYLNDMLQVPPTAEMLASWVLAQLPPVWEWASIQAYDGFRCKVRRADIAQWLEVLRS